MTMLKLERVSHMDFSEIQMNFHQIEKKHEGKAQWVLSGSMTFRHSKCNGHNGFVRNFQRLKS